MFGNVKFLVSNQIIRAFEFCMECFIESQYTGFFKTRCLSCGVPCDKIYINSEVLYEKVDLVLCRKHTF